MKLIKEMIVGVGFLACMVGCRSGLYEFETTENEKTTSHMPYRVVDKLDPEKYSAEFLPVEVKVEKKKGSDHSAGMAGLCCLTIGIIPALYDEFEDYTITVNTPIGSKSANAKLHAKSWVGWICLIPYPASGEERDGNPTLPNERLEEKLKNRVVEALVGKFSSEEYAGYVRKLNDQRLAEEKRVKEKRAKLDAQLAAGEFESVIQVCEEEMATTKKDTPWKELKERAITGMKNTIDTTTDAKRLVALFAMDAERETQDKIVLRLDAINKVQDLPSNVLYRVFGETKNTKVKVAVVHGITDPDKLLEIAAEKSNNEVAAAAYSKLNSDDAAKMIVEKARSMMAYSVIDSSGHRTDLYKDRFDITRIIDYVNGIPVKELRAVVATSILNAWLSSDNEVKFCWLRDYEGQFAKDHVGDREEWLFSTGKIISFCKNITEDDAERLLDRMPCENFNHNAFILGLTARLPDIVIKKRAYDIKEQAREKVNFAGFYCGMTIKDFYVLCLRNGMTWKEIDHWTDNYYTGNKWIRIVRFDTDKNPSGSLRYIQFNRTQRYKLFEKEDGEFWSEYLRTFVPTQQNRGLAKTIEAALDDSAFDYQHTHIDGFDEGGFVYKSIKYNTKVSFGQDSGKLALEVLDNN